MLIKCVKTEKELVKLKVMLPQLAEKKNLIAIKIMRISYQLQGDQMSFSGQLKTCQKRSLTRRNAIGDSLKKSIITRSIRSYSSSLARSSACIVVSSFLEKYLLSTWRLARKRILPDEALCLRQHCRYRLLDVCKTSKLMGTKRQNIR